VTIRHVLLSELGYRKPSLAFLNGYESCTTVRLRSEFGSRIIRFSRGEVFSMATHPKSTQSVDPLKRRLRWPFLGAQSVLGVPLVFQDDEHANIFTDYLGAAIDELDKTLSGCGAIPAGTIRQWVLKLNPEQQQQLILTLFSGPIPDFFEAAKKVLESHKTHFGESHERGPHPK
jgi:hypothetical protein